MYTMISDAEFTDIRGGHNVGNGAVLAEIILKDFSSRPAQKRMRSSCD